MDNTTKKDHCTYGVNISPKIRPLFEKFQVVFREANRVLAAKHDIQIVDVDKCFGLFQDVVADFKKVFPTIPPEVEDIGKQLNRDIELIQNLLLDCRIELTKRAKSAELTE